MILASEAINPGAQKLEVSNEAPLHNKISAAVCVGSCQNCFFLSSYSKVFFN